MYRKFYLLFLALEGLSAVGDIHLVVHVVAGVDAQPHGGAQRVLDSVVQSVLNLHPHILVLVLVSKVLVQLLVLVLLAVKPSGACEGSLLAGTLKGLASVQIR